VEGHLYASRALAVFSNASWTPGHRARPKVYIKIRCRSLADWLLTRFRLVPTFGRSTIRRFSTNASEMKKLAARNYEDLLQVRLASSMPALGPPNRFISVPYPFSTACYLNHITKPSPHCCSGLQNGMRWPSFAFILKRL
jgi:hypothetical protein